MSSRGCIKSHKSKGGGHVVRGGAVPLLISTLIKSEPESVTGGDLGANKPVGIVSRPPAAPVGGSIHHRGDLLHSLPRFGSAKHHSENKRDNIKFIF